jgi:ZIP family zinc transporter
MILFLFKKICYNELGSDDMERFLSLSLTFLVGACFLIGIKITKMINQKKELTKIATGLSFSVMMGMILLDIIPEIGESVIPYSPQIKWLIIIGFMLLGMGLLKTLDLFVPHHHHEHHEQEKNKKEHNDHLFHIGFITSISLILHNIIEGISIYVTGLTQFKTGLLMALAVALHNIPLGIEIAIGMESSDKKEKTKKITLACLTLSSFIGAFFLFLFAIEMTELISACLLCITFGMLLYIALFELLREIWNYRKERTVYIGIGLGIIVNLLMVIL